MFDSRNGRDVNVSLALQQFFLLRNQDVRVFCLKDWLIFLEAVSYVVCGRICFSIVKESVGKSLNAHFFKYGSRLEVRMPTDRNLGPDLWSCKDAWASFGL